MKRYLGTWRAQEGGDSGTGTGTRSGLWRRLSLFGLLVALPVLLLAVFTGGPGNSGGAGEKTAVEGAQSAADARTGADPGGQSGEGERGEHGDHTDHTDHGEHAEPAEGKAQGGGHEGHSGSAGGKCAAKVKITAKGDDYRAKVTVTNSGETEIGNWMVHSSISPDANIEKHWRTVLSGYGLAVAFGNTDKNGTLEPGESTTFGFFVKNGTPPPPEANVCYVH